MAAAGFLLVLLGSLPGASGEAPSPSTLALQSVAGVQNVEHPDIANPCTPPGGCQYSPALLNGAAAPSTPAARGICVYVQGGTECWDACNYDHHPLDYARNDNEDCPTQCASPACVDGDPTVAGAQPLTDGECHFFCAPNPAGTSLHCGAGTNYQVSNSVDCAKCMPWALQPGIALMIKQFRTGAKGADSCPGSKLTTECNLGDRCTPPGLTYMRGMCTIVSGHGMECLDMCDPNADFTTTGKQAGTMNLVEQVRAGRDPQGYTQCPSPTVWRWIWFPLLLCCCVGICALAYSGYQYYRTRLKKFNNKGKSDRWASDEDMGMPGGPPVDYSQVAPQPGMGGPMEEPLMNRDLPPALDPVMNGGGGAGVDGVTTLVSPAMPGQALLNVASQGGFNVGQKIQIDEGAKQEVNQITGFGSLILKSPLQYEHPAGTVIKVLSGSFGVPGDTSIFGAPPSLMGGGLPTTVMAPQTVAMPMAGSTYTSYPVGGSMYGAGIPTTTSYASQPAYGGSMATGMPAYGAYGAYTTQYPTTSMRIG